MTLIKRKRGSSVTGRKRGRFMRRTKGLKRSRRIRKMDMIPHAFSRTVGDTLWTLVNTSSTASFTNGIIKNALIGSSEMSFSTAFVMNDLPAWTEFSNLYDQYRLNYVVLSIKLVNHPGSATFVNTNNQNNNANYYPTIWMVRDHDDASTISLDAIKQYSTVKHKVLQPNREIKFTVKPSIVNTVYQGTSVVPGTIQYKKWNDVAYGNIPHYGAKFVIDFEGQTTAVANQWVIKLDAKYYFQMKVAR